MNRLEAKKLRDAIETAATSLPASTAVTVPKLFAEWVVGEAVAIGTIRRYNDILYKVVQAHTTQADWIPSVTPSLWVIVVPEGVIPVWKQPIGSTDAYKKGDKVHFPLITDPIYESLIDANVWSPTAYPAGWKKL